MTTDPTRNHVRAAIDSLLAGTPLRSDGALTIVALAAEAGIKRHILTHRHTDLKEELYARVRAQNRIPDSEKRLRDELETTQRRLADLLQQSRQQQQTIEALARIVNVLTVENDQLTTQLSHQRARKLVALQPEPSGQ
jgi:septal ring factor EnvC (AmiA/AmiB activator)